MVSAPNSAEHRALMVLDRNEPARLGKTSQSYDVPGGGTVRKVDLSAAHQLVRRGLARYVLGGVVITEAGVHTLAELAGAARVKRSAVVSTDGRYRYRLDRWWAEGERVCWVMLNPSTADAEHDDPTVRRCIGFTRGWGLPGLIAVNLFAWRATRVDDLVVAAKADPLSILGPDNAGAITEAITECSQVIAAWGGNLTTHRAWLVGRPVVEAIADAAGKPIMCLGVTGDGDPLHPLYVAKDTEIRPWR